jgi:2-polyprenylphenol 6-hydroxylase
VALVGAAPEAAPTDGFDVRVYALSPGNIQFLRRLGVWEAIAPRAAPVHAMRIHGDDGRAVLEFGAYEAGVAELAWIVEDAGLQRALWNGLAGSAQRCQALEVGEREARVTLEDGTSLGARLVVGADGANSFVRKSAGIEVRERDFEQVAVVANFHCGKPHGNTAFQWFQGGPVLALLPLPQDQVSMVWSVPAADGARLSALSAPALAAEVTGASGNILGTLTAASPVRSFPLRRLSARRLVAPRVALVGDAGHVVHPLAGQGLNLGLQDARVLAEILTAREPGRDPGDHRLLRRYERQRSEPILAMDAVISGLFSLYGARNPTIGRLRNAGLNLTDRLPVLKNLLMRQAMG